MKYYSYGILIVMICGITHQSYIKADSEYHIHLTIHTGITNENASTNHPELQATQDPQLTTNTTAPQEQQKPGWSLKNKVGVTAGVTAALGVIGYGVFDIIRKYILP